LRMFLDRPQAKGLVRRVPSPLDRRVIELELTAGGTRVCRKIPYGPSRVMNAMLRGFSAAEVEILKTLVRRMLAIARARLRAGAPRRA
jgi:DNA-binding MarR family transcriptional regulator